MRLCQRCGGRFPDDHAFCPTDGTRLQEHRSSDWLVGTLLHGTYRVERLIAEGGMANIYLAVNERIGKEFALKVLDPSFVEDTEVVERFFNEARAAASLGHPGVVEIFDCVLEPSGVAFMVMHHVEGEDVEMMLNSRKGKHLGLSRSLWIAAQTAEVLSVAHAKNIVHRDIKPSNLFIAKTYGGTDQVKVFDFGVARLMSAARVTHGAMILGTPEYMSPEQAKGEKDIDHRSDIYSLGATLYHMVCGRPPHQGENPIDTCVRVRYDTPATPRSLRPDIPIQLESLILWMLDKDRQKRPQSASQVQEELLSVDEATQPPEISDADDELVTSVAGSEVRIVTALVADIEPGANDDIEQQVDETNLAYNVLADAVTSEGGEVGHLAGSRAVGLFGMFMSFGDEPVRAARAAVAIQRRLGDQPIVRVAVGTGRTVIPADSVTTGPAAAAAARLLARVEYGDVVVDESTYRRIRGSYKCRKLSGEGDQPNAYRLVDLFEHVGLRSTATAFGRSVPTVGRSAELGHIVAQFDRVVAESCPMAVTVTGPPGIGKTKLKTDFVVRQSSSDIYEITYLEGAGQGWDRMQSFSVVADLLRRRGRLKADLAEEEARKRISGLVKEGGVTRSPEKVSELLAFAAGVGAPQSSTLVSLSAELLRQRTIDAFVQLICSMAEMKPVVLCIEDAHSVDEASLEALSRLCVAAERSPLLLLFVGRPECWERLSSGVHPEGGHLRIQLQPLSFTETSQFLKGLLGSDPPTRLLDAVWARTNGVPLFIEEVLFALRHQGTLVPQKRSKGWALVEGADLSMVPETVEGLVFAQLDALPQNLKDAARRASVIGTVFWDVAVSALGIRDAEQSIAELAGRDVIVAQETSALAECREYSFRSPMLADVAYRSLPHREREGLHIRAAEWLQIRGAEPLVIAYHLARGGRNLEASKLYSEAGDAAAASFANQEAAMRYDEAIELCGDFESIPEKDLRPFSVLVQALLGKARVLERLVENDAAIEALQTAEDVARRARLLRMVAETSVRRGALLRFLDPSKAVQVLTSSLEYCRAIGHADLECRALLELARASAAAGDLRQGSTLASQALHAARALGAAALVRRALVAQGSIETMRGDLWSAKNALSEALDISRHAQDCEQEAEILAQLGFVRSELGDLNRSERELDEAVDVSDKTQNRRSLAHARVNLGWVYWRQGRQEEAWTTEGEALRLSQDGKLDELRLRAEGVLALFELGEGRLDEAVKRARRISKEALSTRFYELRIHAAMVETLALYSQGRHRDAADLSIRAVNLYNTLPGTMQFETELHLVAAVSLSAAGHEREAQRIGAVALNAVERRASSIQLETARQKFLNSIGAGLPAVVRESLDRLRIASYSEGDG